MPLLAYFKQFVVKWVNQAPGKSCFYLLCDLRKNSSLNGKFRCHLKMLLQTSVCMNFGIILEDASQIYFISVKKLLYNRFFKDS